MHLLHQVGDSFPNKIAWCKGKAGSYKPFSTCINASIIVNLYETGMFWLLRGRLIFNLEWRSLPWELIVATGIMCLFSFDCMPHCIISGSATFDCIIIFSALKKKCIIFFSMIFEYLGVGPGYLSGKNLIGQISWC